MKLHRLAVLALLALAPTFAYGQSYEGTSPLPASRMPAFSGDVATSAGSTATAIQPGVVTAAKMASGAAVGNLGFAPAPLASPSFTGTVRAPTPATDTADTIVPTESWIHSFVVSAINTACSTSIVRPACVSLFNQANLAWWGGACDGTTDNAAAIGEAVTYLATVGGGTVVFPPGTCAYTPPIAITQDNITLQGSGQSTILSCSGVGTANCIDLGTDPSPSVCIGTTEPADCMPANSIHVQNMQVLAPVTTGGFLFHVNGCANCSISDIVYTGWKLISASYFNNLILANWNGHTRATSGDAIAISNAITTGTTNGWYRSDVLTMTDFVVNTQSLGANCMTVDGMVQTVRQSRVGLLGCNFGLVFNNSAGSTSYYPGFLISDDLEIDGASNSSVAINGGNDFQFSNCNLNSSNSSGANIVAITPDTGASETRSAMFSNCEIHDGPEEAMFINAKSVSVTGSQLFDTSHTTARPVIEIGAVADNVMVTGSFVGKRYGDPDTPSYGVYADLGAAHITLSSNDYAGATTSNFSNNTSAAQSYIGGIDRAGAAITVTTCAATTSC